MEVQVGVPLTLLYEGEGHVVTIELKNGGVYRGRLEGAEESMNCQLKEVIHTKKDGHVR